MKIVDFVILVVTLGCGGTIDSGAHAVVYDCHVGKSGECLAEQIVWREWLLQSEPPPPIHWIETKDNCLPYFGQCADGIFWGDGIDLIWYGQAVGIAGSAYVHEHIHAALLNSFGDIDPDHTREVWTHEPIINAAL